MERESTLGLGQVDVNQMARTMAQDIEKQMGIGGDAVARCRAASWRT